MTLVATGNIRGNHICDQHIFIYIYYISFLYFSYDLKILIATIKWAMKQKYQINDFLATHFKK